MKIIFKKISIENFLSFSDSTQIDLDTPGLILITGRNLDSISADSNGAGKSTLFEAIVWGLWGKTVRGYSADEVVNRRVKKDCSVSVEFDYDGATYQITRSPVQSLTRDSLIEALTILPGIGPTRAKDLANAVRQHVENTPEWAGTTATFLDALQWLTDPRMPHVPGIGSRTIETVRDWLGLGLYEIIVKHRDEVWIAMSKEGKG